jgi:hypothetical protein
MSNNSVFELEPAMIDENTEVKVRMIPRSKSTPPSNKPLPRDNVFSDCDDDVDIVRMLNPESQTNDLSRESEFLIELNRLSALFCDLPSTLFVSRILLDYASDEQKLEETRVMLFSIVKENEEFPFGHHVSLKKRVITRRGEPLCVKLANDILILMSVIQGEDMSCLKDLISTSRGRSKSCTAAATPPKLPAAKQPVQCQCASELPVLRDSISGLQAEVLLLKQERLANERLRLNQIRDIVEMLMSVKCDVKSSLDTVSADISRISSLIADPLSTIKCNVTGDTASARIEALEKFVDTAPVVAIARLKPNDALFVNHNCNGSVHSFERTTSLSDGASKSNVKRCENSGNQGIDIMKTVGDSSTSLPHLSLITDTDDRSYADVVSSKSPQNPSSGNNHCAEGGCVEQFSPVLIDHTLLSDQNLSKSSSYNCSRNDVTFAHINATLGTPKSPRASGVNLRENDNKLNPNPPNPIPVRISDRQKSADIFDDEEDFSVHVRKRNRSKRYFVGGFKRSITVPLLMQYISRRGPKATFIRIFPSKRSEEDVIIRINVEVNDEMALIEQKRFWPKGVYCKPWLNQSSRYSNQRPAQNNSNANKVNDRGNYNSFNSVHRNRFEYLCSGVD